MDIFEKSWAWKIQAKYDLEAIQEEAQRAVERAVTLEDKLKCARIRDQARKHKIEVLRFFGEVK